jgi:leucyl/phenylalanyl-tRNA--protein transferase
VDLLSDQHVARRLVDVQWSTPHLASLGVVEIHRDDYLGRLSEALAVPLPAAFG